MLKPRSSEPRRFYNQIGKLAVRWNDLELVLKLLIFALSKRGIFVAAILAADMQIIGLLNLIRTLASEYDISNHRINESLKITARKEKIKMKIFDAVAGHVHHLIDGVDIIREYRNYYVHGILSPTKGQFSVGGMSGRQRFSIHHRQITLTELRDTTKQIESLVRYGRKLVACIEANENPKFSVRPTWPKKTSFACEAKEASHKSARHNAPASII
jgi:hypothetical protein